MDCPACGATIRVPKGLTARPFQCPRCLNVVKPVEAPPPQPKPLAVVPPKPPPPHLLATPKLEPLQDARASGQAEGRKLDTSLHELTDERDALLRKLEEAGHTIRDLVPIISRIGELENRIWELGTAYLKCLQHLGELETENDRLRRGHTSDAERPRKTNE